MRSEYHIPGMSAIVDGPSGTIWEHPFGLADIAGQMPVTTGTLFHLASLTKPFAAVLALQLEQEGRLDLDDMAKTYGIAVSDSVRLWHLLSHTSEIVPAGSAYRYSGAHFAMIEEALTRAAARSFAQLVDERIAEPLQLRNTIPNPRDAKALNEIGLQASDFTAHLARGYAYDPKSGYTSVTYDDYYGPAAGLISTPRDMVTFSRALDEGKLLGDAARARMWAATKAPRGGVLPYGLGWFVQEYKGEKVVWHYGLWTGASALIVKVPSRRLTFVVLANSPMLSMPFRLGEGDLMTSPFATLFLSSFVDGPLRPR